jgi:ankyrin repeat protein
MRPAVRRPSLQLAALVAALLSVWALGALGQTAPSKSEAAAYTGLHAAAWKGDVEEVRKLAAAGADLSATDRNGRTPLHVAAFQSHDEVVVALARAGSDLNALEGDKYDIVTIAAVANDPELMKRALELGASASNITSVYDGTALIAAAHLGHVEVVRTLVKAGAPPDHVNNLGWTALIEAVVLGDGGRNHTETVRVLLDAGADKSIPDRQGRTPLLLSKQRGYAEMVKLLK